MKPERGAVEWLSGPASRTPVIAGIGESQFGRKLDTPFPELAVQAIEAAIADAALVAGDIDAIFTDGGIMPTLLPIEIVEATFGIRDLPRSGYFGVGGMGLCLATMAAASAVHNGEAEAVLVYFGVDWGTAPGGPYQFHDRYPAKRDFEHPYGYFAQPTYFAMVARRYAHEHGLDEGELTEALGLIAIEHRQNAIRSGRSQHRNELTFDSYLEGRMIADPLRVYDCCPISDGAGAFVVTSLERARQSDRTTHAALLGAGYSSIALTDESFFSQNPGYPAVTTVRPAATRAYSAAGIKPEDVGFAEIYDCFTISVLLQLEEMGICEPGGGLDFFRRPPGGSGRVVVNSHGGLLGQAYLLGINHFTEAARQIRGEAGAGQVARSQVGVVTMAPSRNNATLVLGRTS